MQVPSADDPVWRDIVRGRVERDFEHLAIQVFLGKARILMTQDPSDASAEALAQELREFFLKHAAHPKIQRDAARIAG